MEEVGMGRELVNFLIALTEHQTEAPPLKKEGFMWLTVGGYSLPRQGSHGRRRLRLGAHGIQSGRKDTSADP